MSKDDVNMHIDMEDALKASEPNPGIESYQDDDEALICAGFSFGQDGQKQYLDPYGKTVDKPILTEDDKIFQVKGGYEWKLDDGYFWKRKAADRDLCRDDATELEWIRDRKNPLSEFSEPSKADVDGVSNGLSFSEEEWCRISENAYFDEFDKVVKFTFFNIGNRQRGRKLMSEPFEDALTLVEEKSVDTIQALVFAASLMKHTEVLDFFKVLCKLISGGVKAAKDSDCFHYDENAAIVVIIAVAHILQSYRGEKLDKMLTDAWDDVTSWCLHLVKKYRDKSDNRFEGNSLKFHQTFAVLLRKGCQIRGVSKKMCHSKDILRYIAEGWSSRLPSAEEDIHSSFIICHLLERKSGISPRIRELTLRHFNGFYDALIEHSLQRILIAADIDPMNRPPSKRRTVGDTDFPKSYKGLLYEFKILSQFARAETSFKETALLQRLLYNDFFGEITRVIRYKFVSRFPKPDSEYYKPAVECALEINELYEYALVADHSDGRAIERAIDSGYIWHLLKLSSHLNSLEVGHPLVHRLSSIVRGVIPRYFIRPAIVRLAVMDFRRAYSEKLWDVVTTGPLSEEWMIFKSVLLESDAFLHFYTHNTRLPSVAQICSNMSRCKTSTWGQKLMRCSGCRTVFYCSRSCQKEDWRSHKSRCRTFEELKLSESDDESFKRFCIERCVRRCVKGLTKLILAQGLHKYTFSPSSPNGLGLRVGLEDGKMLLHPQLRLNMWPQTPDSGPDDNKPNVPSLNTRAFDEEIVILHSTNAEKGRFNYYPRTDFSIRIDQPDIYLIPESERPDVLPEPRYRPKCAVLWTDEPLSSAIDIEINYFDKIDRFLMERNYNFEPWEGDPYQPYPKDIRERRKAIFQKPTWDVYNNGFDTPLEESSEDEGSKESGETSKPKKDDADATKESGALETGIHVGKVEQVGEANGDGASEANAEKPKDRGEETTGTRQDEVKVGENANIAKVADTPVVEEEKEANKQEAAVAQNVSEVAKEGEEVDAAKAGDRIAMVVDGEGKGKDEEK